MNIKPRRVAGVTVNIVFIGVFVYLLIFPEKAFHIDYVHIVHSDYEVKSVIILFYKSSGGFSFGIYTVKQKLFTGGRIDGIAFPFINFIIACCCGFYIEFIFLPRFFHHIPENEFSHRAAADVAVADK